VARHGQGVDDASLAAVLLLESSTLARSDFPVHVPGVLAFETALLERLRVVLPQALRNARRHRRIPVRCASRRFNTLQGSGLKVPESFAKPGLAQVPADVRRLHANASLHVLKD
jgi:hypothetical protein